MKGKTTKDCPFCNLTSEQKESVIYEDEYLFVIPDKHPIRRGHILVIPKIHEGDHYNLPEETYNQIFKISKILSKVIKEKYDPIRVGIGIFGFDVDHVHVHIVPMFDRDDIVPGYVLTGKRHTSENNESQDIAKEIKESLS